MPLDVYAPCPCGNGQKIKFCCSADIIHELDKVLRAIEGDQRASAVDQLQRLLEKRPKNPAVLAILGSVLMYGNDLDQAQSINDRFLAIDPKNPTALAQSAAIAAIRGNSRLGVERLQAAFEESNGTIGHQVLGAIPVLSDVLLSEGDVLGGYGHAMLYASLLRGSQDEEASKRLSRLRMAPSLPIVLRQEWVLRPAPEEAAWKPKFDAAMELAAKACWLRACEALIALAERVPNEPTIIHNIAVLRGYLGDISGATLWWRKYSTLESLPLEDRVEAEALAQAIDPNPPHRVVEVVRVSLLLQDVDRAMERLLADKRLAPRNREEYLAANAEEDQIPPKAVFFLLDRPALATADEATLDALPRALTDLLVYGRQTDREPRIEFECERGSVLGQIQETLAGILGDALVSTQEEVIGDEREEALALRVSLFPPRDLSIERYRQFVAEETARLIVEVWPETKNSSLDGHAPAAIAAQPQYRVRLLASIFVMEQHNIGRLKLDFNQLRAKLGLPTLDPIDPEGLDLFRLPVWRLSRLILDRLSDEALMIALQRAVTYVYSAAIELIGEAILARASLQGTYDPHELFPLLVQLATTPDKSIEFAQRAQAMENEHGHSPAQFMLMELEYQLALGKEAEIKRLINALSTTHIREPGVSDALMNLMVRMGLITPDGRPRGRERPGTQPAMAAESSPPPGGLWTPDAPAPAPASESKSGLWLPD
jgi:tetratricopeptide (TPR) repeat protein